MKLRIQGCENITDKLNNNFQQMLRYALINQYSDSKKYAVKIIYDSELLQNFLFSDQPDWLPELIAQCKNYIIPNKSITELANILRAVNEIFIQIKNFSWVSYGSLDLDGLFLKYARELKYDELLEKLASHFEQVIS